MPSAKNILITEAFKHDGAVRLPLMREGYRTLGDLTRKTAEELCEIRLISTGCIGRIRIVLKVHRLKLKGD